MSRLPNQIARGIIARGREGADVVVIGLLKVGFVGIELMTAISADGKHHGFTE